MAYKIRWSLRAASNFEDIGNYIAKDSEHYSEIVFNRDSFADSRLPFIL